MKVTEECFSKVKKDCFKFIKSQETSTEKFGNKDGMLKVFFNSYVFLDCKKSK
jgi:D-glycerate 3-kinase